MTESPFDVDVLRDRLRVALDNSATGRYMNGSGSGWGLNITHVLLPQIAAHVIGQLEILAAELYADEDNATYRRLRRDIDGLYDLIAEWTHREDPTDDDVTPEDLDDRRGDALRGPGDFCHVEPLDPGQERDFIVTEDYFIELQAEAEAPPRPPDPRVVAWFRSMRGKVRHTDGKAARSIGDKVYENRLRRMAARKGLALQRARRRDPDAVDYGRYRLVSTAAVGVGYSAREIPFELTLDQVEEAILCARSRRPEDI
jgi:hypothetical protein